MSNAPPWRTSFRLLVPVATSSKEMSIMSGRYMHDKLTSSTRAVACICACSRWDGPPNIIMDRASLHMNSCRWMISATCRVIYGIFSRNSRDKVKRRTYVYLCFLSPPLPFFVLPLVLLGQSLLLYQPRVPVCDGCGGSTSSGRSNPAPTSFRKILQHAGPTLPLPIRGRGRA